MKPFLLPALALAATTLGGGVAAGDREAERWARLEQRIQALETRNAALEASLADDHLSENEPELITRLKAVEFQALGMQKQARQVEALAGITAGLSLTQVAQSAHGGAGNESQLNYRGDVFISLPGGEIGQADGAIFAQFRLGQGDGLTVLPPAFSAPNAAAFRVAGGQADDSAALLAQAWYQIRLPLSPDGYKPHARESFTLTIGKMDPFLFFDQNAVADDETTRFLNSALVHNPLLDAGGDLGADAYGFTPGLRLAYADERRKPLTWGVSAGLFGVGTGAAYDHSLNAPLLLVQLEVSPVLGQGLRGHYRLYGWRNPRATAFANPADPRTERHQGIGLSLDQRLHDALTVFARWGHSTEGRQRFDEALTVGLDVGGTYWNRAADGLGLAYFRLGGSRDFARAALALDADGDGVADFGWRAGGAEEGVELYYRLRLNRQFELGPDLQWLHRPAADPTAPDLRLASLRAQFTF